MRDDFNQKTKELLAKRVGYRCSNPGCEKLTIGPSTDKTTNIGIASHISAASPGGKRYNKSLTSKERKSFENGIWLCSNCASMIDRDEKRYTEKEIKKWKIISEEKVLHEIENAKNNIITNDIELIKFYADCFDRPVFQDVFQQEGSMEAFDKAIEDTIIALNTGVQRDRDNNILKQLHGKSYIKNDIWRSKLEVIVELLRSIRERYFLAIQNNEIHINNTFNKDRQSYCINNRDLVDWFDLTRSEVLNIFSNLCKESGINLSFHIHKNRRFRDF